MTQYMQEAGAMKQADDDYEQGLWLRELFRLVEAWRDTRDGTPSKAEAWSALWKHGYNVGPHWRAHAALAAALPPAAVQAGWKLVPIELTPAMVKADPYGMGYGRLHAIWSRLLAAVDEGTLTAGKQGGDGVAAGDKPLEPIAWVSHTADGKPLIPTFDRAVAESWKAKGGDVRPLVYAPGVASDAPPKAKVLDVGFRFDGGAEYTPTVLLAFPQNDWDARDAFVRAIREGMNSEPTK